MAGLCAWSCGLALVSTSVCAGEKLIESGPSRPGDSALQPGTRTTIDPVIQRILQQQELNATRPGEDFTPSITPPRVGPSRDPELQRRWSIELDKRRNWLLENASQVNLRMSGADAGQDDNPRFSQPFKGLSGLESAQGRYFRSTDPTAQSGEGKKGNDRVPADGFESFESGFDRDSSPLTGANRSGIPVGSTNQTGAFQRFGQMADPAALRPESYSSDRGLFSNPSLNLVDDSRLTALEDRVASFNRLLDSTPSATAPGAAEPTTGTLGLNPFKTVQPSRAQQFQSLLTGLEPGAVTAPTPGLGSGPAQSAVSPRPALPAGFDRPSSAAAAIGPAVIAPAPVPTRLAPRPAVLTIPTRGF
jgi:hypothetical protein